MHDDMATAFATYTNLEFAVVIRSCVPTPLFELSVIQVLPVSVISK